MLYTVEKDLSTPVVTSSKKDGDKYGRASVFLSRSDGDTYNIYIGDQGLYVLRYRRHYSAPGMELYGVTDHSKENCNTFDKSENECLQHLVRSRGLAIVSEKTDNLTAVEFSDRYFVIKTSWKEGSIVVDYTDRSSAFRNWKQRYPKVIKNGTLDDYVAFIDEFKEASLVPKLKEEMLSRFFSAELLSKSESNAKTFSSQGYSVSYAGACKDFTRTVAVGAKKGLVLPKPIKISVSYILKRTYKPYNGSGLGESLLKDATHYLSPSNAYSAKEQIRFDCVTTAIKYRGAGLKGNRDNGKILLTALDKIALDVQLKDITW